MMLHAQQPASPKAPGKIGAVLLIALTLAILAGIIWFISHDLRGRLRESIISQDSQVLTAASILQRQRAEQDNPGEKEDDPFDLFSSALEVSRLKGVVAVRVFDGTGRARLAMPPNVQDEDLSAQDLGELGGFKTISRYLPHADVGQLFTGEERISRSQTAPLLEVTVPMRGKKPGQLTGAAQFILNGSNIAAQFAALDRTIWRDAVLIFAAGAMLIVLSLGWAFWRLEEANALLTQRTSLLLRANHELSMAAKTSALGAITAHLIHGLKNPLFGLQAFVNEGASSNKEDWQDAVSSTKRMQEMITEAVRILQEQDAPSAYEITLSELQELLEQKLRKPAQEAGVTLTWEGRAEGTMPNREANLLALILTNLAQNAIQATPRAKKVSLQCSQTEGELKWEVSDEGTGLPSHVRERLFTPCVSSKAGGSGIGLAISKQLANHLGGKLELARSTPEGTTFLVILPSSLLLAKSPLAS